MTDVFFKYGEGGSIQLSTEDGRKLVSLVVLRNEDAIFRTLYGARPIEIFVRFHYERPEAGAAIFHGRIVGIYYIEDYNEPYRIALPKFEVPEALGIAKEAIVLYLEARSPSLKYNLFR